MSRNNRLQAVVSLTRWLTHQSIRRLWVFWGGLITNRCGTGVIHASNDEQNDCDKRFAAVDDHPSTKLVGEKRPEDDCQEIAAAGRQKCASGELTRG